VELGPLGLERPSPVVLGGLVVSLEVLGDQAVGSAAEDEAPCSAGHAVVAAARGSFVVAVAVARARES
jgi:hypothetical protein